MSQFLANHTAVQCDRLLARYCCHSSICLSVCLSVRDNVYCQGHWRG